MSGDDGGSTDADSRGDPAGGSSDEGPDVVLRLPDDLRGEFKDPMGPVYTDAEALMEAAGYPLIAVGDVVTYHLREANHPPNVAVVDGYTERERADDAVLDAVLGRGREREVENPAATLTVELLVALRTAVAAAEPTTIVVDGEEDLATLPAVLVAPRGGSVVYGQPGEGMVLVRVGDAAVDRVRDLFERLDGDHRRALAALGVEDP